MSDSENKKSRRDFLADIVAAGGSMQMGLWGSLIGALSTTFKPTESQAQIFTHSFWKVSSASAAAGLYGWGNNAYGTLGLSDTNNRSSPVIIPNSNSWSAISVALGGGHALAITSDGKLKAVGDNAYGQLGMNNTTSVSSWVQVATGPASWAQVAGGYNHTVGIDSAGLLWSMGDNSGGNLGIGNYNNKSSPVQVGAQSWRQVSANGWNSAGIRSIYTLYTWGDGNWGQLGNNATVPKLSPVQVTGSWNQVSVGPFFMVGIKTDGKLYGWGRNEHGETGELYYGREWTTTPSQPTTLSASFSQVSAGDSHVLGIQTNGELWAWGCGSFGQLGTNTTLLCVPNQLPKNYTLPKSIRGNHVVAMDSATAWVWGSNVNGQWATGNSNFYDLSPTQTAAATSAIQVACGYEFSMALDAGSRLWTVGTNADGCLGINNYTNKSTVVQVTSGPGSWSQISAGMYACMGIGIDGSLWTWGYGGDGCTGQGSTSDVLQPTQLGTFSWSQVSAGFYHMAAITTAGALYTWGQNYNGQLGVGDTTARSSPVQVTGTWTKVVCGGNHTLAIKSGGTLWAFGNGNDGALGAGNYTSRSSPVQIGTRTDWTDISAGDSHSVGIRSNGTMWSFGMGTYGQLGNGDAFYYNSPVQIAGSWTQVVCGPEMGMATKTDGTVWTWGGNKFGNLGLNVSSFAPRKIPGSWTQVLAGPSYSLGIKTDGTLWAWGVAPYGELGLGDTTWRSSPTQIPGSWSLIPSGVGGAPSVIAKRTS